MSLSLKSTTAVFWLRAHHLGCRCGFVMSLCLFTRRLAVQLRAGEVWVRTAVFVGSAVQLLYCKVIGVSKIGAESALG